MFDHTQYVPILRWKQAERTALSQLLPDDRAKVTPLIEFCPKDFATCQGRPPSAVNEVLSQYATGMSEDWGEAPVFVDLVHLDKQSPRLRAENGVHPLVMLAQQIRDRGRPLLPKNGLGLIPVTGLDRSKAYQAALKTVVSTDENGMCVRLRREDVADSLQLVERLQLLVDYLKLEPRDVDLFVDLQIIDRSAPSILQLCDRIPNLHQWRTFTVASGAFPKDLQCFKEVRTHFHERTDWASWRRQVAEAKNLPRSPAFSDYTIQHPVYKEPPRQPNFTVSIRYTSGDDWVIMKGECVRNTDGPGLKQWPGNALLLSKRPEFCSAAFSPGDRYIYEMGHQTEQTGSATTWLCAGINHHMTFVARQIAGLFRPSVALPRGKATPELSR